MQFLLSPIQSTMLRQSTLSFSSTPRRRLPICADKAPDAERPITSREDANAAIASKAGVAPFTPPSSQTSATPPPPPQIAMDSSHDVDDSTDWISTSLSAFEPLEQALRCEICKGFYDNPVITSCSHTFCSLCIRRSIARDGKCPICTSACQADKLSPNIAVREIVSKFRDARPKALELARADRNTAEATASGTKRKIEETDLEDGEPVRLTRSRLTRSRSRRGDGTDEMPVVIPDSGDEKDEDFMPEGMVKCPSCSQPMKEELVFTHLDVCPGPGGAAGRHTRSR